MGQPGRVTTEKEGAHVLVRLTWNDLPPIDRDRRIRASEGLARLMARKLDGGDYAVGEGWISFRVPDPGERRLEAFTKRMETRIGEILFAPLTPKAVDRALGITPRERIRWYKDGRLPTCGREKTDHGDRTIQFPMFPFANIASIQANPEIISGWRVQDAL
ncbi:MULTISPECIES: hypothetical protein [Xanthobacter]|uniref:hypothetical protein n=1 Tax=Xanthobacter TaxID=279 RepID=UPI002022D746|nr:hypothetical protein [Xanthobacter aminoxidans]MCL8384251.1 hypothetical protein [Xanthobacter aminoxidans]